MPSSKGRAKDKERGEDPKGLYATLGVPADAGEDEIRKAYRRLALRWHPDKNPDDPSATEEFQKIAAAYEVLSDPERREMYDSTGCVDAEELQEGGLSHATDLFAAFFAAAHDDLDIDEQAMLDEFLRLTGGAAFRRKGRRKKGGRVARGRASRSNAGEQMMGEFMAAMAAETMGGYEMEATCPNGHRLKRRKADETYECDACGSDIPEGKRLFDCRKCDYSLCQKCHKKATKEAEEQLAQEEEAQEEAAILEAMCEAHIEPVRQGRKLQFRCNICGTTLATEDAAAAHIAGQHGDEVQAFGEELRQESFGSGGGFMMGEDIGSLFMAAAAMGEPPRPSRSSRKHH